MIFIDCAATATDSRLVWLRPSWARTTPIIAPISIISGISRHRGLKPGARDGDVLTLFNLEYLSGLYRYPHMRWVLFTDIGNVQRHNDFDLGHQVVGLGAGMRWKLLAVSDTDLRVDVAWSKELDGPRFYFSTNLTF